MLKFILFFSYFISIVNIFSKNYIPKFTDISAEAFSKIWYSGVAEVNRYDLIQSRYGNEHKGESVLIFVTEDFLKESQVKAEFKVNEEKETILKLNNMRAFNTGFYEYSTMTSVFSPILKDLKNGTSRNSLKITGTFQDWCGHSFMQLNNLKNKKWKVQIRSYFQITGDLDEKIPMVDLEDELFNIIRTNPKILKTGKLDIAPSLQYLRFTKLDLKSYKAEGSFIKSQDHDELSLFSKHKCYFYQIIYQKIDRKLVIAFEKKFPYKIIGFIESNRLGNYPKTSAILSNSKYLKYWEMNKNEIKNSEMRKNMGFRD